MTDEPAGHDRARATTGEPADPGGAAPGGLRASDADRTRTADWLAWAAGSGQLTLTEAEDRLARAYAARTVDELAPLTADLQPRPAPTPARPTLPERLRAIDWSAAPRAAYGSALLIALVSVSLIGGYGVWVLWPAVFLGLGVTRAHHHHGSGHRSGRHGPRERRRN